MVGNQLLKTRIMRKVVLISSFCDTQEKLDVLNKNINIIKNENIDIILISPFCLPVNVVDSVTYFFKTNDNPILEWPIKSMYGWVELLLNGEKYHMAKTYSDYGWSGLVQVKQLSEIALNLNYDQFIHMIYDVIIDENVLRGINSEKTCSIYPSFRDGDFWKASLHFMIFDKINLKRFISYIHLDSYLSFQSLDALMWLENLHKFFPYNHEEIPVQDEIYFYRGQNIFNYSPTEKFDVFIVKDDETKETIKLLFSNISEPKQVIIKVNSTEYNFFMSNFSLFDTGIPYGICDNVEIILENQTYNLTKTINKIKHNTLRKC